MDSFKDVITAFGTAEILAGDIGEKGGTVRQWRNRNSIPSRCWERVAKAAEKRGIEGVDIGALAAIAARSDQREEAAQ